MGGYEKIMIDFHTHILPGVDDGSKNPEESIAMLREEARQGVQAVVLTPHFYAAQNSIEQYLISRQKAWENLQSHLEPGLPKLYLGAEVQYFEGISAVENLKDLRIQGTKLLLLEMPFSKWSDRIIHNIISINQRDDIQVVLAHIDRYLSFQSKDVWQRLLDSGILMQVNTSFFHGFWKRHKAIRMVRHGQIHMLGTDCHNMHSRKPDWSSIPSEVLDQIPFSSKFMTEKVV